MENPREISRRTFLKRAVFFVAGAATTTVVGCDSGSGVPPISTEGNKNPTTTEVPKPIDFYSEEFPYKISFPSDWGVLNVDQPGGVENDFDEFFGKGKVFINATPVDSGITLDQYKDKIKGKLEKTIEKSDDPSVKVYESTGATVDGVPAWAFRHRFYIIGTKNEQFHYVFINGGKGWSITFSALQTEFENQLPIFQQMVDSFRFTNQPAPAPTPSPYIPSAVTVREQ